MRDRKFRVEKREYLSIDSIGGDFTWYQAKIQVRFLWIFWITINVVEDLNKEYVNNRSKEILGYVSRNEWL